MRWDIDGTRLSPGVVGKYFSSVFSASLSWYLMRTKDAEYATIAGEMEMSGYAIRTMLDC